MTDTAIIAHDETVQRSASPSPPPPDPSNRIGQGMLVGLLVVALLAAGGLAAWLLTHRPSSTQTTTIVTTSAAPRQVSAPIQKVAVPVLVGLAQQDAVIRLGRAGLKPKLQQRTTGPTDGLVNQQHPAPGGKVAAGSLVTILVDRAKPVPKPPPQASTATTAAPTTTATVTTTTAATPSPAPQATMPDVATQTEASAAQALSQAGLLASIVFVPAQDPLGTVEQQARPAGSGLPAQSHVQINVSTGPGQKPQETVPDVIGKTLTDALSAINRSQLRLIFLKLPVPTQDRAGKVVQQTPLAGGRAPRNAQVLVYLGAYRPNG
jgi:beta-lactam-binding protein with PASTA domain